MYKCNSCLSLFNKPKVEFGSNGTELPTLTTVCLNCGSKNFKHIHMKELKIVIFDDEVDCGELDDKMKSTPCKYGVKFTDAKSTHISKIDDGYAVIFRISDFNNMDEIYDVGEYIMQFIIDTSKPDESFIYNFKYEISNELSYKIADTEQFKDQVLLLISALKTRSHNRLNRINKVLIQSKRVDVPGDHYPGYVYNI